MTNMVVIRYADPAEPSSEAITTTTTKIMYLMSSPPPAAAAAGAAAASPSTFGFKSFGLVGLAITNHSSTVVIALCGFWAIGATGAAPDEPYCHSISLYRLDDFSVSLQWRNY